MTTQTQSGKAFEYALAKSLAKFTDAPIRQAQAAQTARLYFKQSKEQAKLTEAADEAVAYLWGYDRILRHKPVSYIDIQGDAAGKRGDVRDVIVCGEDFEIGLSAKNRHEAIKHSRLSRTIDFGKVWTGYPVSKAYWKAIAPVFAYLDRERSNSRLFADLKDKDIVYKVILGAFKAEFKRLCEAHGRDFITKTFKYLVGEYDFYKVISQPKDVIVQPFNINGTLGYGHRWRIPDTIERIAVKPKALSTLLVSFAGGWQISFRIHNAASKVEPSLKFDINFVGVPSAVASRHIPLSSVN